MLSLLAHVAAGGSAPTPVSLAVVGVGLTLASLVLTARRLRMADLVLALGAAQLGLHEAFMWLDPARTACQTAVLVHAHHGAHHLLACGAMRMDPHSAAISPALMTVAHAVAAVLLAVLLAHGERALWFLAQYLRDLRPRLVATPGVTAPGPLRRPTLHLAFRSNPSGLTSGGLGRRGPPPLGATASS